MSLKTKGFSHETEAFILIGGGETHSELLIGVRYISQVCSIKRRESANRKLMRLPVDGTSTLKKQRGYAP
jgi:hypothetical protein